MNLEQVLTEQLQELHNMVEVLTDELNAIVARDHTSLISVVKNKTQILQSISQRDKQIAGLLNKDLAEQNAALITQINQRLVECKKQNEVNQVAVTQSQIASQKMKDILFGKSQTGYDKTGKSTSLPNQIARGLKA
jgi:flagella synthesis protein FlgN